MVRLRWDLVGVVDILYLSSLTGALALGRYGTGVGVSMVLFALLIVLVDWYEARQIDVGIDSQRSRIGLIVISLVVLAIWLGLATRDPGSLEPFFALTAAFFLAVAVRETIFLNLTPVELVLEGYVSLVAVYLVLGAASSAVSQFQGVLVVIAIGVYVGRNLFWWVGALLDRLATTGSNR